MIVVTRSAEETRTIGRRLAAVLVDGDVVLLHGDLGAGKTTLAQGIGDGLGVTLPVRSPTFTIRMDHEGRLPDGTIVDLVHLDLYRLEQARELVDIGYGEVIDDPPGIVIIEWPERAGGWLPARFLSITFEATDVIARSLTFTTSPGDAGQVDALGRLAELLEEQELQAQ